MFSAVFLSLLLLVFWRAVLQTRPALGLAPGAIMALGVVASPVMLPAAQQIAQYPPHSELATSRRSSTSNIRSSSCSSCTHNTRHRYLSSSPRCTRHRNSSSPVDLSHRWRTDSEVVSSRSRLNFLQATPSSLLLLLLLIQLP